MSAEASYLSGGTLTAICASNGQAWSQTLTAVGLPAHKRIATTASA